MRPVPIARWSDVPDREPMGALVGNVDHVIVRYDDEHSVLYGRCDHRGALLADGSVRGDDLVCGVHGWDYGFRTGISAYDNDERLAKFSSWVDDDAVATDVTIGASAAAPLRLEIPLFVSDMSFGALSEEAKVALRSRSPFRAVSRRPHDVRSRPAPSRRHPLRRGPGLSGADSASSCGVVTARARR